MGPLDPTPPMVTAGAPDTNTQLAQLLRRRQDAAKRAQLSAGNAQMWDNTIGQPQFTQAVDGGRGQPDQVVVNWGDILGKGVSNYMGAKERKRSVESQQEVESINNEFMQSTLKNDPTATKLYGAAQAGMPGAEKALAEHLSPKKEKMAVLVQGLTSGQLDPEMAEQLAPQYGLDPGVVRRAAEFAAKKQQEKMATAFSEKATLQEMKLQGQKDLAGAKPVGKTGYTQDELNAMPLSQRLAAVQASSGRETVESKERGKLKVEAETELPKTDYAMENINRVLELAKGADYWPGNLGLKGNKLTTNPNNVNLRQAIYQLTLDAAGGRLGAGFSNADREFVMGAQADLDSGNEKTVTSQLEQLITRLQRKQDEYRRALGTGTPTPQASSSAPARGPSFDDVFPPGTFEGE